LQARLAYAKVKICAIDSWPRAVLNFNFLDPAMQNTFAPSLPTALLNAFNTNNRINHYLIDHLPAAAWKAKPPEGKGRTIQAIVAHMHNVRVMWLKSAAKGSKIPNQLDRAKVTAPQALRAMEQSREALSVVLGRAITRQRFSSRRRRLSRLSHRS